MTRAHHEKGRVLIGVTPRIHYADQSARGSFRQTLFLAQSAISERLAAAGALAVTLPSPESITESIARDYASRLDGLLLQGGADIAPSSYGQSALRDDWRGDARRDATELAFFRAFFELRKPILGLCRGCQLVNVACGGTLFQDLLLQRPHSIAHSDPVRYDEHYHRVKLEADSELAQLLGCREGLVNSIHHQGIDRLGANLRVEARCDEDGLVEAISHRDQSRFVVGVQWHAELLAGSSTPLLPASPLFAAFCDAALNHFVDDEQRHRLGAK